MKLTSATQTTIFEIKHSSPQGLWDRVIKSPSGLSPYASMSAENLPCTLKALFFITYINSLKSEQSSRVTQYKQTYMLCIQSQSR